MAEIESAGQHLQVRIRNISEGGALVEGAGLPARSSAVTFIRDSIEVTGVVAWSDGKCAGIAFDTPLDPETLMRPIAAPRARLPAVAAVRRPGFHERLSPAEQRWIEGLSGPKSPVNRPPK